VVVGAVMRTLGELEAAVCEGVSRFEQDYMGRGPKDIHTHLLGDLLVVRLRGVLTAAEQHLVKSLSAEKGRDLLKQVRTHLIETARPVLEAMVHEITGVKVFTLHHDISTVTGEEVILFTLAESPYFVEAKKKWPFQAGKGAGPPVGPKVCQRGHDSSGDVSLHPALTSIIAAPAGRGANSH
jgi:uncharacterized protein YbcI